jgi:hypothetical protein
VTVVTSTAMTTPTDPPTPVNPPPPSDADMRLTFGNLCAELCNALGVDPERNQGFSLTAIGGNIPELTIYALPPQTDDGDPAPDWVNNLRDRAVRGLSFAVLPGQNMDAPPARDPGPVTDIPADNPVYWDAVAARLLRTMAEVINGAYVDGSTRERLTVTAHDAAMEFDRRLAERVFELARDAFEVDE